MAGDAVAAREVLAVGASVAENFRLLVFYRGRIVAAFRNSEAVTPETLGAYMLGFSRPRRCAELA